MKQRKEHTLFYFTEEVDQALRKCDEARAEELRKAYLATKVVVIEPGMVKAIDGKEYYNPQRIIAGHPDDVAAYHKEEKR